MRRHPAALYIAFDVFPRAKGSSTHIASMVRALARNFASVRLLCLGVDGMPAFQREGAIEIFRYCARHRHLLQRATGFARFVTSHVRQLASHLRIAAFRDPWGGYPLLRAQPACPVLFEVNALPSWELAYSRPGILTEPALMAKLGDIERRCLHDSHRILCVSSVTRRALVNLGVAPHKIEVIPNAAGEAFPAASSHPCPIPELLNGRWFGYLGGLQPWQGVNLLLDAFALLANHWLDVRLLLLPGDSTRARHALHRQLARLQLEHRVMIHSPISHDQVPGVLSRLEFTAVPLADTERNTVQGCCPLKLVESMAAGVPVIAADLAVCREWVTHEREALLAAPGDVRAWALAIHRLLADAPLRHRLARAALLRAQAEFGWKSVHARLDRLFQHTIGAASYDLQPR